MGCLGDRGNTRLSVRLCQRRYANTFTLRAGPAGLVTRTLYVLHRSWACHEVWCPKVGQDSWVREATGVSVQRIPPKNWGEQLVVVRKRFAHENGTSP